MRIGLTFFLRRSGEHSIWANGADQQCVFLWQLLRAAGHDVIPINAGDGPNDPHPSMMLGGLGLEFVRLPDVIDTLDCLIEAAGQVEAEAVARVRSRGGRAVSYKFGNAYVIDAERCIHGKPSGSIFNGARFDEVWTNPQHEQSCRSFWEIAYRCPLRVLPQVWEPTFIEAAIREFPSDLRFGYRPGGRPKRAVVFEPNHNIVKTCFTPMLVCEQAHRAEPGALSAVYVTNALKLKGHVTFEHFACSLDIVKDGLCSFEGRHNLPWFMAKHGDVVVSHQWENALNFAYYDAIYGGYPLVHNSEMLPVGVGYRYEGFDATDGARALLAACADVRIEHRRHDEQAFLRTIRATAPTNIDAYQRALHEPARMAA